MDSVNSVALDSEPWDQNPKLLVAAHVDLTPSHGTIKARSTTMMPNIRGLSSFIPLIFAPKAELRVDPKMRSFTGAICGLGMDEINETAFYPDHDMEVIFDVKITNDDVIAVSFIYRFNFVHLIELCPNIFLFTIFFFILMSLNQITESDGAFIP